MKSDVIGSSKNRNSFHLYIETIRLQFDHSLHCFGSLSNMSVVALKFNRDCYDSDLSFYDSEKQILEFRMFIPTDCKISADDFKALHLIENQVYRVRFHFAESQIEFVEYNDDDPGPQDQLIRSTFFKLHMPEVTQYVQSAEKWSLMTDQDGESCLSLQGSSGHDIWVCFGHQKLQVRKGDVWLDEKPFQILINPKLLWSNQREASSFSTERRYGQATNYESGHLVTYTTLQWWPNTSIFAKNDFTNGMKYVSNPDWRPVRSTPQM